MADKRESVLIVAHADGYVEAFARKNVDVRIVQMPSVAPRNEPLAEQYLEENLPQRYRKVYFPNLRRAADMVRRVAVVNLFQKHFDLALLAGLNRAGEKKETQEQGTAWTL